MTPSELKDLNDRLDHHEGLIHGNRRTWQSGLDGLNVSHAGLRRDHAEMRHDLAGIRVELTSNTEVTTEVRDILGAAKNGLRFLNGMGAVFKWLGIVSAAIAAIVTAVVTVMHGGPK